MVAKGGKIVVYYGLSVGDLMHKTVSQVNRALRQLADSFHIMADEYYGSPPFGNILHLPKAFFLKLGIAYCQDFVDNQNLGFEMGGDGEGEADLHAAAVALDGGVEEFLNAREVDNLVELAVDLPLPHAEDCAVHVDVFAAGQLGMKAGADLQQAAHPAADHCPAMRRLGDAAEDFQQRALAGAVATDDADDFSLGDLERNVSQRPKRIGGNVISSVGRSWQLAVVRRVSWQLAVVRRVSWQLAVVQLTGEVGRRC